MPATAPYDDRSDADVFSDGRWGLGMQPGAGEPESVWSAWSRSIDHVSVGVVMALFAIGVVLSFAASPTLAEHNRLDEPFYYAWRHLW
ncbi:MAG: hypothetical protein AAFR16_14890, partial [Pseudomonadota bacterium]